MQKDLVSTRSPIGKGRTWHLRDIASYVVAFSGDQHGSHFIQTELPNASSEERQTVFDEIVPKNASGLIQDVIQKLFEHGTQPQKSMPANTMEGHVFYLSCNLYGRRVVQKAIELILQDQCVKDFNGNHVIQKGIERVSPDGLGIVSTFIGNVFEMASHPLGCRVLQRCLEHLPDLLANHVPHLMQDQLGNYVIQFILEHGRREDKALIVGQLPGHLLFKALVNADSESRRAPIEIMAPAPTPHMFVDYVLQRVLGVTEGDQKETLINTVRPQLLSMQRYSTAYSKHLTSIEHQLERLLPKEAEILFE
ncbi:armadillo-type protein [Mycena leptocephala]|nr:armadillo-type protein [Mycena leptocephala]